MQTKYKRSISIKLIFYNKIFKKRIAYEKLNTNTKLLIVINPCITDLLISVAPMTHPPPNSRFYYIYSK